MLCFAVFGHQDLFDMNLWAAANGGVTNGGLRGVWPPFLEIGQNRPFSPFFCVFRPFPEGAKGTWEIQKTEEKGLFPQISSDFLKPPSLKHPFAAPQNDECMSKVGQQSRFGSKKCTVSWLSRQFDKWCLLRAPTGGGVTGSQRIGENLQGVNLENHVVKYKLQFCHALRCLQLRFAAIRIATSWRWFQIARFESQGQKPFESLSRL